MSTEEEQSTSTRRGRVGGNGAVLLLYSVTSAVLFGWSLWPHPGRAIVGLADQPDPEIFVWSFAWWPHAIGEWTNPFVTHAVYQPVGANLMWTTTVPGLALAFMPLTLLFGPVASFNVAALLMPALSAWTAFLLCRYLTRSAWAAIVGGYLFGFSSYVVGHQYAGHLHLTSVFLVPLVPLVIVRYARGELSAPGLSWRLGLILAFQFSISTEVTLTLSIALALGLLLGFAIVRDARRRIVSALVPIGGSYVIAAVIAAPFVFYALSGFEAGGFVTASAFDGDLLNIVLPTRLIAVGGSSLASFTSRFAGNDNERALYLGVPTLLIVGLYAWRRSVHARFLVSALAVAWILALGASLRVHGSRLVALPWALVNSAPVLDNVITTRFAVYASLSAGVAVALWIASASGRILARPVVLPALALVSIVPATWHVAFTRKPERWPFFTERLYKLCIPRGETLAIFPYGRWGDSMVWQAESGFWFKMAEGNLGRDTYPGSFVFASPTTRALQFEYFDPARRPTMRQLAAFAKSHRVDRMVSVLVDAYPDGTQLHAFGPLQLLGGMYVAPACGYNSLAGDTRRIPGQ